MPLRDGSKPRWLRTRRRTRRRFALDGTIGGGLEGLRELECDTEGFGLRVRTLVDAEEEVVLCVNKRKNNTALNIKLYVNDVSF
jgi:hypothetical protein